MKLYKLLLSLFLPITLSFVIIVVLFSYNRHKTTLITNALENTSENISKKREELNLFLNNSESEVMFLSQLSNLDILINTEDEDELELAKSGLEKDFLSFSNNRKIYYQIRYIDETGQEIVRVDSDGTKSRIVGEDKLQNKKGRYYFDDAMELDSGSIFVSQLDLNIENGEIENLGSKSNPEYVPVIRYATPVFDNDKNHKGIVLTNIYADNFLSSFKEEGKSFLLINEDGFYLSHQESDKEWGFMFDNNETIQADYPLISKNVLVDESAQLLNEAQDNYFTFSKVNLTTANDKRNTKTNWVLLSVDKKIDILKPVIEERNAITLLISVMFIVVSIVGFIISKMIFRPIGKLKLVVEEISKGKLDVEIDESVLKNKSEVGDLARAFERTLISLKVAMHKENQENSENNVIAKESEAK